MPEFLDWQQTLLEHLVQWIEAEIEREHAVDTRDESQRLLEATFNSPETFISILDADGTLIRVNETALEFIGADEEAVTGNLVWETAWWNHDEALTQRCQNAIKQAQASETARFEAEHIGVDGEEITTSVVARPVVADGAVQKIIVEGTDITPLKQREEQIEFFNSILRHDILNGMNVIEARGRMLADSFEGEQAAYAETIVKWSRNITDLTQKVRSILGTVSTDASTELEGIELAPVIKDAVSRADCMDEDCTLVMDVESDITVVADDLLIDVIGNILINAVEHGGLCPTIEVTTNSTDSLANVHIADDGPGVPPEEREAIFEKGECRNESTGTGFGLYFVSAMVDSYGGNIRVEESDPGGSEFVIALPTQ